MPATLKALKLNYYQLFGVNFFTRIRDIVVTGACAYFVIRGEMTIGVMMTISYILGQLKGPTDQFVEFIRTYQDAFLAYERIEEVQQKEQEQKSSGFIDLEHEFGGISIEQVHFKYDGSFNPYIFTGLTFYIPFGKVTAIVGSSGSGKSTILKLLLGFYQPQAGAIFIDDTNLTDLDLTEWRKKCGVVMQDGFIYSGTVIENIAMSTDQPDISKIWKALDAACLSDFIRKLPLGLFTKIGKAGIELSGGQKQRILIARAVYKDPEFLIFDEATSSLDSSNEIGVMENLNELFKGKTVVIIAHRLSTVRNADQIIVLENGSIVEKGNHRSLVESQNHYYKLVRNQLELG